MINKKSIKIGIVISLSILSLIIIVSFSAIFDNYSQTINELQLKIVDYENQINELNSEIESLNVCLAKSKEGLSKNITIDNNFNPHIKSNLSITELNIMLHDTGLKSHGADFYEMEQTYNINALFAMGVAMHESANGYSLANSNNYFGFRNNIGWMSFNSPHDCIMYFGELISTKYNDRHTIYAIQTKYCTSTTWGSQVKNHMNILKNKLSQ